MNSAWSRASFSFIALLLLHDPIITLTGSAVFSHTLLILSMMWFCISLSFSAQRLFRLLMSAGLASFCSVLLLAGLGVLYSLMDTGSFNVRIQFLASFVLMPLIWIAILHLSVHSASRRAVLRLLFFYVATELAIMLLQISYFIFGIGLPPGELYESMIPGSQYNGNNLAAIVVIISIFYNATSQDIQRQEWLMFNLITVTILLITFSRLAVLLFIFDRIRSLNWRNIGRLMAVTAVLVLAVLIVGNIENTGNETIDSSLYKAKSIATIVDMGFETDRSTSSRSESYFNFIDQLERLGVGSVAILDYSTFTSGANFDDQALYVNPHSMVIEFGYWMGWPGLLALCCFIIMTYARSNQGGLVQRGFILIAVLLASSIPSSAIPLLSLWVGLFLVAMIGAYVQPFYLRRSILVVPGQPSNLQ